MPRLRAQNIAMSLDGFVAGAEQSVDDPLGVAARACTSGCSRPARGRGIDVVAAGYEAAEHVASERVAHVQLVRTTA